MAKYRVIFEKRDQCQMAPPVKINVKQFCSHYRLLEVLELPQLAETCVRNGHYEEALELKQYVTRLNKKLGSIPIVAEVVQVQDQLELVQRAEMRAPK